VENTEIRHKKLRINLMGMIPIANSNKEPYEKWWELKKKAHLNFSGQSTVKDSLKE
jgi:hypothetical protein